MQISKVEIQQKKIHLFECYINNRENIQFIRMLSTFDVGQRAFLKSLHNQNVDGVIWNPLRD